MFHIEFCCAAPKKCVAEGLTWDVLTPIQAEKPLYNRCKTTLKVHMGVNCAHHVHH